MGPRLIRGALCTALLPASAALPASAITLPPDFVAESITPGANFDAPTAIATLPDGRILVAEKRGRVYVVENWLKRPTPMWAGENEVLDNFDRGLLGIAVDPGYASNRYIYLLYTVDPDSNGIDGNDDAFGRLTRYQVSLADPNLVDYSTRTILMGATWGEGPASGSETHTIGGLVFGRDSSLIVSAGEGAQFVAADAGGEDPGLFGPGKTDPYEDIGAFRAQYIGSLAGKILRINPLTGHGYASNPYADSSLRSVRSRVWAYGLRNPSRITVRPGTGSTDTSAASPGSVYMGEVGWNTWEEMNIVTQSGVNFGWPCYEGLLSQPSYQAATPAHHGCGTIGTPANPGTLKLPTATWHHGDSSLGTPPGFTGNAAIGGVFYTSNKYPAAYRNQYFLGDYGQNWIKVGVMDASDQLVQILDFADGAEGPVGFGIHPTSGDVLYLSIWTGEVRRIRYVGPTGDAPPVAVAGASPAVGDAPLTVNFSSAGSSDPENGALSVAWIFGDGQGSTQPNPQHTYVNPGNYQATLIVTDPVGGEGRDTLVVNALATSNFPTTPVVDNFNRANGPIGGAWTGDLAGLIIDNNALTQNCCYSSAVWNGAVFGPDQEVYVTLNSVTTGAPEHDLMLKVQGLSYTAGHIEVFYDETAQAVYLVTYAPGPGWEVRGGPFPVLFQAGDQIGARAYANGTVQVYKNGGIIATGSVGDWPFAALGGRIGLTLVGAGASRLDDFGGGNADLTANTPPQAMVMAPADSSFYVETQLVSLAGQGSDAQDASGALEYRWEVDFHHNNHVHPNSIVLMGQNASFTAPNLEDGTGTWLEARLRVTDSGGLRDTAIVQLFPEVDLEPSLAFTTPGSPGTAAPADYQFKIHNRGRVLAALSRWRLVADGALLAEGDTTVAPLDSVTVTRTVPPALAAGSYTLRVKVDSLGALVETDESNNASARPLTVVEGPGTVGVPVPPPRLRLSAAFPNPSAAGVTMALDLPGASRVGWSIHDVQGRQVWDDPARERPAGRTRLSWRGEGLDGAPARAGLYLARVTVDGRVFQRRFVVVK